MHLHTGLDHRAVGWKAIGVSKTLVSLGWQHIGAQVLAWPWKAPLLNYYEFGLVTVLLLLQTTTPSFQEHTKACPSMGSLVRTQRRRRTLLAS